MNDFVLADSGIRQLHARFIDAVWRKDAQAFSECFAKDGEWKIAGMHMKGRMQIVEAIGKLLGVCDRVFILATMPLLELTAEGASGRLYCSEFAKMPDGSSAMALGIYYDRYVEEDGRWRFKHRHWSFQYRGPMDLTGPFAGVPDYGPFPVAPGPDEPTYVRPR
jgi:SnoaL-like domain